MAVFDNAAFDDHERVLFCDDPVSGLRAIIAIHNTSRGPALGGCRMWPYPDAEAALSDVLRLARGMTYKSALAGLPFGGGKAVVIGDPASDKSPALFHALGRAVQDLGGRYTIAEDVGITVDDVQRIGETTRFVAGVPAGGSGDPAPATAYGVFVGIKAAVKHRIGGDTIRAHDRLDGITVAIQGIGHVGWELARQLGAAGAKVLVSDIDSERVRRAVRELGVDPIPGDDFWGADADVLAPCALGGGLDAEAVGRINAKVVAGAANNQLAAPEQGRQLRQRGILYAPDYVLNAGGIINISHEGPQYDRARAFAHVALIHDTLLTIFQRADQQGLATSDAADRLAEEHFTHPSPGPAAAA
jgi:leucine dehydrogenase